MSRFFAASFQFKKLLNLHPYQGVQVVLVSLFVSGILYLL